MANRANNIWAKAAAGSPGTNIARAQQSRWTGIPNEAIMRLVEDKIGSMLEGISDATERNAAGDARRCSYEVHVAPRAGVGAREGEAPLYFPTEATLLEPHASKEGVSDV